MDIYSISLPSSFQTLSSFPPTMAKVLCTCSCGRYVSRSTKQNHLKGRGTTALRATVLAETESLKISNPDEGSSRKRFKVSHFDVNARPETDESSIIPMDDVEASPAPEVPSAHADPLPDVVMQSNRVVERTRHVLEQCWGAQWDNRDDNGEGGEVEDSDDEDRDDKDEDVDVDDDDEDGDIDDEDNEHIDNIDIDDGDNDDGNNEDNEAEDKILGLSTWDLLGEDFEREAKALGLS